MAKTLFSMQLMNEATGKAISAAGGHVLVVVAGGTTKRVLLNAATGASLANPFAPTRGNIAFMIDNVSPVEITVDLYIMSPTGHFIVVRGVKPGDPTEIFVDPNIRHQTMILPFDIADTTAATETDTGFNFVAGMVVHPEPTIFVTAIDATEDILVGLLSTESGGDADGFIVSAPVGVLGAVLAKLATTGTLGALLRETVVADAGTAQMRSPYVVAAAVSVTYTLSTGSDTAKGFFALPYRIGLNL